MRIVIVFFSLLLSATICSQSLITVYDSVTQKPIVGVSIGIASKNSVLHTDFEGRALLPNLTANDLVVFSHLGYQRVGVTGDIVPNKLALAAKNIQLRESVIRPKSARDILLMSFDSFQPNHAPFVYSQNCFYREELIFNNNYLKFQELEMKMYQWPKGKEERIYYRSNSVPKINRVYYVFNEKLARELRVGLGKIVNDQIGFRNMSMYSFAKGTNILNFVYTQMLSDKNVDLEFGVPENIQGIDAIHIVGKHYAGKSNFVNSHVYLEPNTLAVMHFELLANADDVTRDLENATNLKPGFKERALLWVLGISYKVKKFYCKIHLVKNKNGIWTVSDYLSMFPFEFKKRKFALDGYIHLSYRFDPQIFNENAILNVYATYRENQKILENQDSKPRFGNLPYAIPLTPIQKERL
ncbi:MAG: hypothetical protein ACOVP5_05810, partial [Chitinophagales bacterium]